MILRLNNEINRAKWDQLISSNLFSSPFQTPAYYDFIKSVQGYSVVAAAVENNNNLDALAVVTLQRESGLKSYLSRRGIIYGGILFDDKNTQALDFLLEKLGRILNKESIYLETRNFFDYSKQIEKFAMQGWQYVPYCNFQLKLSESNLENILSGMDYNRRREIKLGLKQGATFNECRNENDLKGLYSILERLYKERVKLPLPSLQFFQEFYKSRFGKVFVVKHHDRIIGGSFCPVLNNRAIYTFYYCGIRNYHKKIYPTHLAVLAAIEYAWNNGIPMLDFMGAGKPHLEYGVRKYKKQFGGELVEHGRFLKVMHPGLYALGKIGINITAKLKT